MQTLQKLSNRIFYLPPIAKTDRPILAAIKGDEQTLIVDAGNSTNHAKLFKEQLASNQIAGDLVALTHSHWDHIFGLDEMELASISNQITYENIKEMKDLSWEDGPLDKRVAHGTENTFNQNAIKLELGEDRNVTIIEPTIIFEDEVTVDLGGVTCILEQVDADHSPDSTLIFIPEEKALFLGDSLYANMVAKKWYYTSNKMKKLLEKIESYDAETFFLSHHSEPLTKEQFTQFSSTLKLCCELTVKYQGQIDKITSAFTTELQRDLTESDLETITYFVNGLTKK